MIPSMLQLSLLRLFTDFELRRQRHATNCVPQNMATTNADHMGCSHFLVRYGSGALLPIIDPRSTSAAHRIEQVGLTQRTCWSLISTGLRYMLYGFFKGWRNLLHLLERIMFSDRKLHLP